MLRLVDVHAYYGESHILHGIQLEVKEGCTVALLGRNGMGKTTTIRTIMGFTPPRSGIVNFKGNDITSLPCYRIARMGLGLVPQGRRIFSSLSVKENLSMSARNCLKEGAWSLERVLSLFPILKIRASLKGNLLSGGEQQMLCIGRALMTNPDLLLMDEPSEGLAPLIVREIGRIIRQLTSAGLSILLVEQNLDMVLRLAHYVYIMSKGAIVYEGMPGELEANEGVKSKYLGIAR